MTVLTMPEPPPKTKHDPRQRLVRRSLNQLKRSAAKSGDSIWVTNIETGFYASKVDVAKLRNMLAAQLRDLSPAMVRKSWKTVKGWLDTVVHYWVQRMKEFHAKLVGRTIRVRFLTKDDFDWYEYTMTIPVGSGAASPPTRHL